MLSIKSCPLPDSALLAKYQKSGAYTDCYQTEIPAKITQSHYISAFYSTPVFKLERIILKYLLSKPSSADQLQLLAQGRTDSFAAWTVEDKCQNQLLMCDYRQRTRSWLMIEDIGRDTAPKTRLYFGSAVVPLKETHTRSSASRQKIFTWLSSRALLGFHKAYSVLLLHCAKLRLGKTGPRNHGLR